MKRFLQERGKRLLWTLLPVVVLAASSVLWRCLAPEVEPESAILSEPRRVALFSAIARVPGGDAQDEAVMSPVETGLDSPASDAVTEAPGLQDCPSTFEPAAASGGNTTNEPAAVITGLASWYGGDDGLDGLPTASGEIFDAAALTAAHRDLPFNTLLKVTYLKTGKSVVVRVNDRGPFRHDLIIDLSRAAADTIGLRPDGIGMVEVEVVE